MEQPLGEVLEPKEVAYPPRKPLHGTYTSLVPLEQSHAKCLFRHIAGPGRESIWTYLPYDCMPTVEEFEALIAKLLSFDDLMFFAVLSGPATEPSAEPVGIMAYMNIVPEHRRIEIAWLVLGDALKRTRKATEAFYLLLHRAFVELGYERVEWKANALNAASRAAAERLGFLFEGIFRSDYKSM
jgi:RimJ/RimL family protein N-acetyltransferase